MYIKQHSITKLKYFGYTTQSDPYKYLGSGTYWTRHINKHGRKFVKTLKVFPYNNRMAASEFALKFSRKNNIVKSKKWANLCEENALVSRIAHENRKYAFIRDNEIYIGTIKEFETNYNFRNNYIAYLVREGFGLDEYNWKIKELLIGM